MTSFKKFLESKELGVNQVRTLSEMELHKTKVAVQLCLFANDLLKKKPHEFTLSEVISFQSALEKAAKYFKFAKILKQEFDDILNQHHLMKKSWQHLKQHSKTLKSSANELKAALFAGDRVSMQKHKEIIDNVLTNVDHHIDAPARARHVLKRTFTETPSFFQTTRLLKDISERDYEKIAAIDFTQPVFTHLDFPTHSTDSLDYVLHFLLQLSSSPKPRRETSSSNFRTDVRVKYAHDIKFKELLSLTDKYIHHNEINLIPKIIALINHFPEIKRANEQMKRQTKMVYRGLGFSEDYPSDEEIIEHDHERQFVATSDSYYAAKNFALQKGHLEDASMRRSNHGVIIHYEVSPEAILFDTRVIDTAYSESEILIDVTKAIVKQIEEI